MIEIAVNRNGKKVEVNAKGEIEGYGNAVQQFVAVLMALDEMDKSVLADAIGKYIETQIKGEDEDDE